MGILNITPDSFYAESRMVNEREIAMRTERILSEGGDIIDIGACSTRPGYTPISVAEEMKRLRYGLNIIRRTAPDAILSVDTFHADVAAMCVEEYGVSIINDISAGRMDKQMFDTIARLNVPYVLTHMQGVLSNMQQPPVYENLMTEILQFFAQRVNKLHELGVNDIFIDPGFGFEKSLDDNYQLMSNLSELHLLKHPLLIGISRKSMIYKLLETTPEEALGGTIALHMTALAQGVHILRVHDVKACRECIRIWEKLQENSSRLITDNTIKQIKNPY